MRGSSAMAAIVVPSTTGSGGGPSPRRCPADPGTSPGSLDPGRARPRADRTDPSSGRRSGDADPRPHGRGPPSRQRTCLRADRKASDTLRPTVPIAVITFTFDPFVQLFGDLSVRWGAIA